MKNGLLLLFCFSLFLSSKAVEIAPNPYQLTFKLAYQQNPTIPKGYLEAVAFSQSRFHHITPEEIGSCIGIPEAFGVMGLIEDGKGYFRSNLNLVSQLSGITVNEIKSSPEKSILAYAKAYSIYLQNNNLKSSPKDQVQVLIALSELPNEDELVNNYALNSHLYQLFWFLNMEAFQEAYEFQAYKIDLEQLFGTDNYKVLSSGKVSVSDNHIWNETNNQFRVNNFNTTQSTDYGPAVWNPTTCNYSSRNGTAISAITIHDVEGSYAGCISWFKNCSANASAHYVLRSSDGQITQMVRESDKAWHVGSENPYTIGFEHEGYYNQVGWYTTAMMTASANLCKDICNSGYGINPLRAYNGPSCNGICALGACVKIKGHQHYPNQTHVDPGQYWDWYKFYNLINDAPTVNTITATSGTIYDIGGAAGNYNNDERTVTLIQPTGATNITLNFTAFNLETNWDYLYIYDGATASAPLIGRYTGTTSPGVITSSGGSLLLDFRSDCATVNPGYAATFNSTVITPSPTDNVAPTTQVFANGSWQTQSFTAAIVDTDNAGGTGVQKGYYQVIDFDGNDWRANDQNGFFADNFDNYIHTDWTQKTGTWNIANNALTQSDDALGNTNIYAALKQNLSNRYLYHFTAKIDGAGTNRRAGFHFACSRPDSLNRYDGYFAWFRLDDSTLQIYKVVNDVFGTPVASFPMNIAVGQNYDYKIIYDRITGKIWVYLNNGLVGTYTDSNPYANGTHISFRSGNATMAVNELKVYRSRSTTVNVSVGSASTNDIRYQNPDPQTSAAKIKSISQDSSDNLSAIFYQDLDIDWTIPMSIDSVRDGAGNDISVTNIDTMLIANWDNSFDTSSSVVTYWYSIGTAAGLTDVKNWTGNMSATTVTATGLNLTQGQLYYFNVKAENGAGLFSGVYSSNGQLIDTLFGTVSIKTLIEREGFAVFPNPFNAAISIKSATNEVMNIEIKDLLGRTVYSNIIDFNPNNGEIILDLSSSQLAAGTYNISIYTKNIKYNKLIIKQ